MEKRSRGDVVRIIVCIALVLVAAGAIVSCVMGGTAHAAALAQKQMFYEQKQEELAELNEVAPETDEHVSTVLISAKKVGQRAAEVQNTRLKATIDDDDDVYYKTTDEMVELFGKDDSAPFALWYSPDTADYEWRFASTFDFTGETLPCTWFCEDEDGKLMAYALADYSVANEQFTHFEAHVTTAGAKHTRTSEDPTVGETTVEVYQDDPGMMVGEE